MIKYALSTFLNYKKKGTYQKLSSPLTKDFNVGKKKQNLLLILYTSKGEQ